MKLSITVIALFLVPIVRGQILNQGGDSLQVHSKEILDLQLRLSTVEHLRNEDSLRIADLAKWQQIGQRRIADLENQQQIDRSRISDLLNKRDEDNRTIADLEKKRQDDQQRIADLEKKRQNDRQRISDLEKQQRGDQRRMPSARKTRSVGLHPRNSELPSPMLETSNHGLKKRVSPDNQDMVAFYAVLTHTISQVADLMEMHFDRVITNIGGSYSGSTGTFTCTHAGVYVFSWVVQVNHHYMYTELVKNGVMTGNMLSGDYLNGGTGGGTVVVHLDQADEVWVRVKNHYPGSTIFDGEHTTTFSGFLLQ